MKRKIMALVLCMILSFAWICGCAKSNSEGNIDMELITEGVEYKKSEQREPLPFATYALRGYGDEVMPIGGYAEPIQPSSIQGNEMPDIIRQDVFDAIAECGINWVIGIHYNYSETAEWDLARTVLEMCEKAGILYSLPVKSLVTVELDNTSVASVEKMVEVLPELLKYKSFGGIYGKDEPHANLFPGLKLASLNLDAACEQLGETAVLYHNIVADVGVGYTMPPLPALTYEELVEQYTQNGLKYAMYDLYPFELPPADTVDERWFRQMSTFKRFTEEANIPWWAFIQTGGLFEHATRWRIPTENEFYYNVNTLLAYGAKGIAYFPVGYPAGWAETTPFDALSIMDPRGEKNIYWYWAKNINKQICAIDHVLMQSKHVGLVVTGDSPAPIPQEDILGTSWRELTGVDGDGALIGCFDYKGRTALYVVNNRTEGKNEFVLHFGDRYGYDVIQRGETAEVAGKDIPLTLNAGEGALIVLK